MFLEQGLREAKKIKKIISVGAYAELKTLQITVNVVNIIKRRKRTLTKPASKQTVLSPGLRCPLRNGHSLCPVGIFVTDSRPENSSPAPSARRLAAYAKKTFPWLWAQWLGTHRLDSDYRVIPFRPLLCSLFKVHGSGVLCQINWQALYSSPNQAHCHSWERPYMNQTTQGSRLPVTTADK